MSFVLVSTTTGDELVKPQKNVVMTSDDRAALEAERKRRAAERKAWLATHEIPWWTQCSVIADETIEEVPTLTGGTIAGNPGGQHDGGLSTIEKNL